tara:strand:+ start:1787 stop:2050 length:264 start_codon:yes stop_codon:yes gene_type:complete
MKTKEQVVPKWFKGEIYEEGDMVTNKFSGANFRLNALELSMYDYIIGSQYVFEIAPKSVTPKQVSEFQKALTWFRKNNVDAYFVLLD